VVELRFPPGQDTDSVERRLAGLADRVEALPDRVLLYAADGEAVLGAVHGRGVDPVSSLVRRSTLEDVFLRLTGRTLVD
jgi:lipooligosaccharide transport system ATP-binding protein